MADSELQCKFDEEFLGHLQRLTKPLGAALRRLLVAPLPGTFEVLLFEIQADWGSFPVYAFALDRTMQTELYLEPPFKGQVLSDSGALIPIGAIEQEVYEAAGVSTFISGARLVALWFGECWHAVGGASFPLPAYIHLKDNPNYFDLKTRKWIPLDELKK